MKSRLDQFLVNQKLVPSRSQAESYIRLGKVKVDNKVVIKPGHMVNIDSNVVLDNFDQYVSRAGLKLASVANDFGVNFLGKTILDVGSSTGGFTDYALQNGASKVIAVEVGKNQLHESLRANDKIELHEQTDIRQVKKLTSKPDIVLADVSFVSLRNILPHVSKLIKPDTKLFVMVKPQFEAINQNIKHKGVIKNEKIRREILREFEEWAKNLFVVLNKKDSEVAGEKGNKERFFLLQPIKK